jgi:hypothetical protein
MRTGPDFKSAQFDQQIRGEAEDWIKMRRLEILSELEDFIWHLLRIIILHQVSSIIMWAK